MPFKWTEFQNPGATQIKKVHHVLKSLVVAVNRPAVA